MQLMKHLLLLIALYITGNNAFSQVRTAGMCWEHNIAYMGKCPKCVEAARPDTIPAHLLVSHRPPSFGHSIEGYCVVVNGTCTGKHIVYRRNKFIEIKPPYDVWRCIRKGGQQ